MQGTSPLSSAAASDGSSGSGGPGAAAAARHREPCTGAPGAPMGGGAAAGPLALPPAPLSSKRRKAALTASASARGSPLTALHTGERPLHHALHWRMEGLVQHILEARSPAEPRQDRRRLRSTACGLGCPPARAGRHAVESKQELIHQHLAALAFCSGVAALHLYCSTQCSSAGQHSRCCWLRKHALPTCVHQIGRLREHERGVCKGTAAGKVASHAGSVRGQEANSDATINGTPPTLTLHRVATGPVPISPLHRGRSCLQADLPAWGLALHDAIKCPLSASNASFFTLGGYPQQLS